MLERVNDKHYCMQRVHTDSAPAAIGPYSQAMISDMTVYTSGQIAINPATGNIEAKDIKGQTEQVMKNIGEILEAAGATYDTTVKTVCYLKNIGDFAVFNEIYEKYFTSKPARSCVEVSALPKNALVEVKVIAKHK